jgi:hypothetical protein
VGIILVTIVGLVMKIREIDRRTDRERVADRRE